MKKEAQELGFDPWGDTAQKEFERRVTDLEQHALENPEDDLEILFYEQEGFSRKANASAFCWGANHRQLTSISFFLMVIPHLLEIAVRGNKPLKFELIGMSRQF